MSAQLSLMEVSLVRVKTYEQRGCCHPCWCARCTACGEPLTKHDYTEQDARAAALYALDQPGPFQHRCPPR